MLRSNSYSQKTKSFLDDFIQWMRFRKILNVIEWKGILCDFGCGHEGTFLFLLRDKIEKGYGFDVSVDKKLNDEKITLISADLSKSIPIGDETANISTSFALLEHLDNPKMHIGEVYRTLKVGGVLAMTTPTPRGKWLLEFMAFKLGIIDADEIRDHKHYYTEDEIRKLLISVGFLPENIVYKTFQMGMNSLTVVVK